MLTLYVYAAAREGEPWASDPRTLGLGVGKVAATMTLTERMLADRPEAVVLFGVAGAYPRGPEVGEVCLVTADWLADEGVITPGGFLALEDLSLGERGPYVADMMLTDVLDARLGRGLRRVVGATVSTCSGTDRRADERMAACPGVAVETMEGAAVGAVCAAFGVPWAQLRVISNRTGNRDLAGWDLEGALSRLHEAMDWLLPPAS
ncbi:futalosine hydrolase [Paraliomyxa miuraensis]|uniref:futalosine hydrolase n=1 Tax=Paraliomyxa miuraensis TaxID=376150 RepID=UPI00225258D5|nr:futalosine hydrolase [Paraliomyxa miuraensis]MCX4239775.1 futalosine hydrolase [Paraliomyxa miuraensis]